MNNYVIHVSISSYWTAELCVCSSLCFVYYLLTPSRGSLPEGMSQTSETGDRCESPPAPTRCCSNHCTFYANPECNGMCSICFKAFLSTQKSAQAEGTKTLKAPPPTAPITLSPTTEPTTPEGDDIEGEGVGASPAKRARPIRCLMCHKRLGLMGFTCRCGGQFCQTHRYPEEHECAFDRKAAEKVKLEEENPVILSDKIERV